MSISNKIKSCLFILFVLVLNFKGNTQHGIHEAESIYFNLQKQLEQSQSSPEKLVHIHLQLGEFYHQSNALTEALDQYQQGLELFRDFEKDTLPILLNNNIGRIYIELNNYDLALQYFNDAINQSEKINYKKGRAEAIGLYGSCFEKKGHYLKALKFQEESLALFESMNDNDGIAFIHENIGSIYEDLTQYGLAKKHFLQAYELLRKIENNSTISVLNNLGDVFRKTGDLKEALKMTKGAFELAEKLNDYHQLESASKDLAKTYTLLDDYKTANKFLIKSIDAREQFLEKQNIDRLNTLQMIYEHDSQQTKIQFLEKQNKASKTNQVLLLVSTFAIMVTLGIFYKYNLRKRKARLKLQEYEKRALQVELEKKAIEEKNLQKEVDLKTSTLSKYSLHLSQKNKLLSDTSNSLKKMANRKEIDYKKILKGLAKEIDFHLDQENEWDEFLNFFEEVHPDFLKKLSSQIPNDLSPAEMRLSILLRLNLSTKEIASILRITPDSVRVARYRLRKKLPIKSKEELVNFLIQL